MLVDDDESGSDYDKEHDQGHFDGWVRRASPRTQPRRNPMMPADGRATVIDPDGRRTACCWREGLDMGDGLKLVPYFEPGLT